MRAGPSQARGDLENIHPPPRERFTGWPLSAVKRVTALCRAAQAAPGRPWQSDYQLEWIFEALNEHFYLLLIQPGHLKTKAQNGAVKHEAGMQKSSCLTTGARSSVYTGRASNGKRRESDCSSAEHSRWNKIRDSWLPNSRLDYSEDKA